MAELEFAQAVDSIGIVEGGLLELLAEGHPVYLGKGEQAVIRMRGYVLSRLARVPDLGVDVLPFVREELETGQHAYTVGAAARVLIRICPKNPQWQHLVEVAIVRLRNDDDAIQFEVYPLLDDQSRFTTAKKELERARDRLSASSGDAGGLVSLGAPRRRIELEDVILQDHDGEELRFGSYFAGRPSFVTFFYTRCNNPNKCSANLYRLADLRNRLDGSANLAAITYDAAYDNPSRLRSYAETRGVQLGPFCRIFRAPSHFVDLQRAFGLNVGFSQTTVNRHASEAFVLDASGVIARSFSREQWNVEEVLSYLHDQVKV